MAPLVKVLAAQPFDPSSVLRTHVWKERVNALKLLEDPKYMSTCAHTHKKKIVVKWQRGHAFSYITLIATNFGRNAFAGFEEASSVLGNSGSKSSAVIDIKCLSFLVEAPST